MRGSDVGSAPGERSRGTRRGAAVPLVLAMLSLLAPGLLAGCGSPAPAAGPTPSSSGAAPPSTSSPSSAPPSSAPPSTGTAGDTTRLVAIGGGRSIVLRCSGSGSPEVVLISGLGETADNWTITADPSTADQAVFQQTSRITRVCAYDRPGTGTVAASGLQMSRSTLVAQPTTPTQAADDLQAVLTAAGEPGPYVLVGHSYGGVIARLFAAAHPRSVDGLLMVDALTGGLVTRLTPEQAANLEKLNSPAVQGRPPGAEAFEFARMVPELQAATAAPATVAVPTVVLSADRKVISAADIATGQLPPFVDQAFADALWSAQLAAQDELAARFPGATHVTKTGSGHYIHLEQPRLVDDAIAQVVAQARGQATPTR